MDYAFTDEQRAWKDMLEDFMEKEVGREYTRWHDEHREFPEEVYQKIADNGWLGLLLTEEWGGLEADPIMYAIFCETIAKFSLADAACIMTPMFTATNIAHNGSQEQKEKYLPAFVAGKQRFSISISEPDAGSDAAGIKTTAVLDGDEWVINGQKTWCSGASHPNTTIALMARTSEDRHGGLSMFLVPNDTPGLTITKIMTQVRKSQGTNELFFDNVRIPASSIIGEVGKGWFYVGQHLEWERLSLASTYVGNARTALDDTINYTKNRYQFGRPISSFQVLKHRMAQNEAELNAARLLVYSAASKMVRGERAVKEVSMAKMFAAEIAFGIATNGMQALGGYAQVAEYDMERYFREAKHAMVGGGTQEIQRTIIAKEMGL